ncbi:transcriptional regulator MraZ [Weissella viridescens]|uniref:Transcriptional regulator MraZ n=1 Tax=Weissella viridescens TaxID=1629 RepID=A0A3P2RKR0_WEIVI|nr:division/cell wall cluster transcriptional repressor MraZ [Weissella viridescens]RRG18028.1 transcriptional regulator MraZ [Weissella viridescens]
MFMGTYQHTVDAKNRLIIPAKFRNQLGDSFVVTRWMEHSIRAYTQDGWDAFSKQVRALPETNAKARQFKRFVLGGAQEVEFDKQGRITLTKSLCEYAQLEKDATVFGLGEDSFEIWSTANWQAYEENVAENFDDIADGLEDLGI